MTIYRNMNHLLITIPHQTARSLSGRFFFLRGMGVNMKFQDGMNGKNTVENRRNRHRVGCVLALTFFLCGTGNVLRAQLADTLLEQREKLAAVPLQHHAYYRVQEDSVLRMADEVPSFGIYRNNYFVTGVPTNHRITKRSADVRFQISLRQRLTQSILPGKTFLFLTYTQNCFWNVYQNSAPFRDVNFNPSLSLGKFLIGDNELRGILIASLEHESNGRDSSESRSWNFLSAYGTYLFNPRLFFSMKLWLPFLVASENKNILIYRGIGYVSLNYQSRDQRFWLTAVLQPRKRFMRINTTLEAGYKINLPANQYVFFQYYNGYGESLLDYDRYTSMIRIGFCIRPGFRTLF